MRRKSIVITGEKSPEIERHQDDSEQWMIERRIRLTASRVGGTAKMQETTKNVLYRENEAICYGSPKEDETRNNHLSLESIAPLPVLWHLITIPLLHERMRDSVVVWPHDNQI